jgi:PhzF family phenazine biosynthesis protein
VATEINLSETAFPMRLSAGEYTLRWFTPATEVPLCGHATLAAAHVLWEEKLVSPDGALEFHTRSGLLTARRNDNWICLEFPAIPVAEAPPLPGLSEALGGEVTAASATEDSVYLVELDSEATVRALTPDFARLHGLTCLSCIVTAKAESGPYDFVSRFFAPKLGIDEDPVTGAAHCSLAPYWSNKLSKAELVGQQVSQREGTVKVRVHGDRVDLLGQAVTVMRGELLTSSV